MEKKYTNEELEDAVCDFWSRFSALRADGESGYVATSIAFDEFKEKLGWRYDEDKS